MESAAGYLNRLYGEIKPKHVVEIGADTRMELAAHTTVESIKKIGIVAWKEDNDFRKNWWWMHREMGIPVYRIDGDAANLNNLIREPVDVVVSHRVLYGPRDKLLAWADHRYKRVTLSADEIREFIRTFREFESTAISAAHEVAKNGHVIWFGDTRDNHLIKKFSEQSKNYGRKMKEPVEVLALCGQRSDLNSLVLHSYYE